MSAKMKRRRRHDRRKRILIQRHEDALFFSRGIFPASAASCAVCPCGARAFSRGLDAQFNEDFYEEHSYCDEMALS